MLSQASLCVCEIEERVKGSLPPRHASKSLPAPLPPCACNSKLWESTLFLFLIEPSYFLCPAAPFPLGSPAELPPWSCRPCWEGKHTLLCTLHKRHPAPPGIPDQAGTPGMTNSSLAEEERSFILHWIYSWLSLCHEESHSLHSVSNKECHLFL